MRFKLLFVGLALLVSSSLAYADEIGILWTGEKGAFNGNNSNFDDHWKVAYLGEMGIGYIDNTKALGHDGLTPIMGDLINAVISARGNSGADGFSKAFIYDDAYWPILNGTGPYKVTFADTRASWIGAGSPHYKVTNPNNDPLGPVVTHTAGYYAYEYQFFVEPEQAGKQYFLYGNLAVDNGLFAILVDDEVVFNGVTDSMYWQGFDYWQNGFRLEDLYQLGFRIETPGEHTLTFITSNYGNDIDNYANPAAFWAKLIRLSTDPPPPQPPGVPEPATVLLFVAGLAGLGCHARRNWRK